MSNLQSIRVVISECNVEARFRNSETSRRAKVKRGRRAVLACEALEGRVVLTTAGVSTSLLGSLSYVGVVTSPEVSISIPVLPIFPVMPGPMLPVASAIAIPSWSHLEKDLQALRTELESLAAKSGVTIADLQSLTTDSQAISQTGFHFDVKSLNSTISELATAVAGQTSTSPAQTDFTALFNGSSVSSTTITKTFKDLIKAIQDSAVTTTDLSTVASDEAAIQADLPKLPIRWYGGAEPWLDGVGIAPAALTVGPSVVTPVATPLPAITVPPLESVGPAIVLPSQSSGPLAITVSPPISVSPIIGPASLSVPPAIIISPFGGANLLGALASVGVVTSPVIVNPPITMLPSTTAIASGAFSQLQTDVRALETELQSLAAKSGLTIADLQNLVNDGQAINQAGFYLSVQSLDKVVTELATAVAGGSSTTQAQTDFTALFSNSSVSTATFNSAFNDLVKAIQDSTITTGDLTTVAADQAAIQADLKNLFPGKGSGSGSGTGTTGTGTGTGTTGTGTGTTGTGTTGTGTTGTGSKGSTKGHKPVRRHKIQIHLENHVVVKAAKAEDVKALSRAKKR
jgi:hypothetical protein